MADFAGTDHTDTDADGGTTEPGQSAAGEIRKNGASCFSLYTIFWSSAGEQGSVGGR